MGQNNQFTKGPILGPLIRFALPVLLALFLQAMYGAVDLMVVGQFATAADVSAVATGSQVMYSMMVIVTGLSMGLTVLVGRKIGEGKAQDAGTIVAGGIWLFALLTVTLSVIIFLAAPFLAGLMRAPAEAFPKTVSYVRICSCGTVFIVSYNLVGSIFRGIGDSKMPLVTVAIACVLNILGDLLLVAGLGMGASGAALATAFAQAVSVVLSLLIIRRRKLPFVFRVRDIRFDRKIIGSILRLGIPIALQDLLVSISFMVIMSIVNGLGVVASAGVGVAEKLCAFIMLVPSSYMQSMSAFVAQNMGAEKPERARKALLCGILSSLAVSVFLFWLGFFHGDLLARIFAREEAVVLAAADYLRAYALDCLMTSFLFCFIGYFNGCGLTVFVMTQGLVGAFGIRIPVAFLMSRIEGVSLFRIGMATPCATATQILMCGVCFLWLLRRQKRQQALQK